MIRLTAMGDLHFGPDTVGMPRPHLASLPDVANLLLLAGDFTRVGDPAEAIAVVEELTGLDLPMVAVLGNHDYHANHAGIIMTGPEAAGIRMLDGESTIVAVGDLHVSVVGARGSDFGEPAMKAFIGETKAHALRLEDGLRELSTDIRLVLLHSAPVEGTLRGERLEISPFLGRYLLAEAIDRVDADLVLHGHAHGGTKKGVRRAGSQCATSPNR